MVRDVIDRPITLVMDPPPDAPVVEVLDERGRPTGIVGRAFRSRETMLGKVVEVASGGRRLEVPASRVRPADVSALPSGAVV